MPSFSGKFQYQKSEGVSAQSGPCQVAFDAETFTLTPQGGTPLALDLGDIDVFAAGEYDLTLTLYTGAKIVLHQFGKAFQNLTHDLREAHRARLVECLLLEDLEEIARFEGTVELESAERAASGPAELRLYKSNLAVLPMAATGFQWRLADISSIHFDEARYSVVMEARGERLTVTRLAKRTREFSERLQAATQLAGKAAETVHSMFPFLTPDQLQRAARLMQEGHAAPVAELSAIHPLMEKALVENVVDTKQRPYFDALVSNVPAGYLYTGFKVIRKEDGESAARTEETITEQEGTASENISGGETAPSGQKDEQSILHWFFFPLAATTGAARPDNVVAWEATSTSGRATYFFRLLPPEQAGALADPAQAPAAVATAIQNLNRALILLNFRREPIYLPDDKLEIHPRYRRYAIACRKIPELRRLRASFLGRAIHTSPADWRTQVLNYLTATK